MKTGQIYRMLAADHFDLLSDRDKHRLAEALAQNADIDPADFLYRLKGAFDQTQGEDREGAFMVALAEAESDMSDSVPESGSAGAPTPGGSMAFRGILRLALAAAVGAAAFWAFTPSPDPQAPLNGAGQPVFLNADRSAGGPEVDIEDSTAPFITLIAESRIEASDVTWQVLDGNLKVLDSGTIGFAGNALRTVSVQIPKEILTFSSSYWFVLSAENGEIIRRWSFRVE